MGGGAKNVPRAAARPDPSLTLGMTSLTLGMTGGYVPVAGGVSLMVVVTAPSVGGVTG